MDSPGGGSTHHLAGDRGSDTVDAPCEGGECQCRVHTEVKEHVPALPADADGAGGGGTKRTTESCSEPPRLTAQLPGLPACYLHMFFRSHESLYFLTRLQRKASWAPVQIRERRPAELSGGWCLSSISVTLNSTCAHI